MHVPTQLFNAAGIVPDPTANANPVASFWFNNIAQNLPWSTYKAATPAPNPVAIANAMPSPVSVQQISKFQGEFMGWIKPPGG